MKNRKLINIIETSTLLSQQSIELVNRKSAKAIKLTNMQTLKLTGHSFQESIPLSFQMNMEYF